MKNVLHFLPSLKNVYTIHKYKSHINLFMTNGLSHCDHLGESTVIIMGMSGIILNFYTIFPRNSAKQTE